MRKKVRLKLMFGSISKWVPDLPQTLEELHSLIKVYIDSDSDIKDVVWKTD